MFEKKVKVIYVWWLTKKGVFLIFCPKKDTWSGVSAGLNGREDTLGVWWNVQWAESSRRKKLQANGEKGTKGGRQTGNRHQFPGQPPPRPRQQTSRSAEAARDGWGGESRQRTSRWQLKDKIPSNKVRLIHIVLLANIFSSCLRHSHSSFYLFSIQLPLPLSQFNSSPGCCTALCCPLQTPFVLKKTLQLKPRSSSPNGSFYFSVKIKLIFLKWSWRDICCTKTFVMHVELVVVQVCYSTTDEVFK